MEVLDFGEIGGIDIGEWLDVFDHCHASVNGSLTRVAFPDGKPLLEQEAILVQVFSVIGDELHETRKAKNGKRH